MVHSGTQAPSTLLAWHPLRPVRFLLPASGKWTSHWRRYTHYLKTHAWKWYTSLPPSLHWQKQASWHLLHEKEHVKIRSHVRSASYEKETKFWCIARYLHIPSPVLPTKSSLKSILLLKPLRGWILWRKFEVLWLEEGGKFILSKGPSNKAIADIWLTHMYRAHP